MLDVKQAEQMILDLVQPFTAVHDSEVLELLAASGRILAEAVTSQLNFPHWDNSAMDGYALRYEDVQSCSNEHPVGLEIVEEIPAGYQPQKTIRAGQAARILTGSVMPTGADTVVMQEETRREGDLVLILAAAKPGAFVRRKGDYYQAGATLLPAGTLLQAPEIAILAAAQCAQVKVLRQPRVAILSTGSELVGVDQPLQPGQIVDSNRYALTTLVAQMGAIPVQVGIGPDDIVPDDPEQLKRAVAAAIASADVVLSSGGVSVGDYDYVEQILTSLGGTLQIQAVAMKPGKPLTVATFPATSPPATSPPATSPPATLPLMPRSPLYFGLPGNPVSALVTFWRFVQPALRKLAGLPAAEWGPTFVRAMSRVELRSDGRRESYLWGQLVRVNGGYEFHIASGKQISGNLINLAGTNGLAVLPIGKTQVVAGEFVQVMQIGSIAGTLG